MKAFCCWSGGKESALSYYRSKEENDLEINCLLNMVSEDGKHSRTHGVSSKLLRAQAKAIGIPIIQRGAGWKTYEEEFKKGVLELKGKGVDAGIFGDIDLQEHRDWVERVCKDMGIKPVLPLWEADREGLLTEFIKAGFKATVVAVRDKFLGKEWLGREINTEFIKDLKALGNVDLSGENGEYHSFVFDGPIFKKSVNFNSKKLTYHLRGGNRLMKREI